MRGKYVFIRPYCGGTEVIGAYQSSVTAVDNIWGVANLYHSIKCKEKMVQANLKGDVYGIGMYVTTKKNGFWDMEKSSSVSCYVCPKCGYLEMYADKPGEFK